MKARRIGNGKGVDAIANVNEVVNAAFDFVNDFNVSIQSIEMCHKGIIIATKARDAAQAIIDDLASGKIDDGDIMDYMIETGDVSFMDDAAEAVNRNESNIRKMGHIIMKG